MAAVLCALGATAAYAQDYFVSLSGNDSNPGTQGAPWSTIGRVNAATFSPGDRVFFQSNQTFTGHLIVSASSVTVSSYDAGKVPDAATGRAVIRAITGDGITLSNVSQTTLSNMVIQGPCPGPSYATDPHPPTYGPGDSIPNCVTGSGEGNGLVLETAGYSIPSSNVLIRNVEVNGFYASGATGPGNGIFINGRFDHLTITGSQIHDNYHVGVVSSEKPLANDSNGQIFFALTNFLMSHNSVYNTRGIPNQKVHTGPGVKIASVRDAEFVYNETWGNGGESTYSGGCGMWVHHADHVIMHFNESHHNEAYHRLPNAVNLDAEGFDLDGATTNSVMEYNYSHDNAGYGFLLAEYSGLINPNNGNIIRYNVSQNDCRRCNGGAINLWSAEAGQMLNAEIYNNVIFVSSGEFSAQTFTDQTQTPGSYKAWNNFFVATPGAATNVVAGDNGDTSPSAQGNFYYKASSVADSILKTFVANPGAAPTVWDPTDLASALAPYYRIASRSPLAGHGVLVPAPANPCTSSADLYCAGSALGAASKDFFGVALPFNAPWDIGASQSATGSTPAPTPVTIALEGLGAIVMKSDTLHAKLTGTWARLQWNFLPAGITSGQGAAASAGGYSISSAVSQLSLEPLPLVLGPIHLRVSALDASGNLLASAQADFTLVNSALTNVEVYPNPWRADKHRGFPVTFGNLAEGCTVKIFTLSGHWVETFDNVSGQAKWFLKDHEGNRIASGLYFYLITDSQGDRIHGKIGIIR